MAQLSEEAFAAKWVPLLANNDFQNIDGTRLGLLVADVRDSFVGRAGLNVRQVKGATYPVPYPDSLGTIPAAYRVLGMRALARNGLPAAQAALSHQVAAPIYFQLLANAGGDVLALLDEQAATTATVPAVWVRVSGTSQQVVNSFPLLVAQRADGTPYPYNQGDKVRFVAADGTAHLYQTRQALSQAPNPEPTGLDSDPYYQAFAPLLVEGGGDGAAAEIFNGARAISRPGQFQGLNVGGTSPAQFLNNLFFPATPPAASLAASDPVRRFGSAATVTLTYSVQAETNPITGITVNAAAEPVVQSGGDTVATSTAANTDTDFALSVTTGSETTSAGASVVYRHERFWFVSSLDLFSYADADLAAFIGQQNGEFADGRQQGRSFACDQQFIYFYWPQAFGAGSFVQNGLPNTAFTSHDFAFTNAAGYSEPGRLTRTVSKQGGAQTITVN